MKELGWGEAISNVFSDYISFNTIYTFNKTEDNVLRKYRDKIEKIFTNFHAACMKENENDKYSAANKFRILVQNIK
jgi:hypothetical protein